MELTFLAGLQAFHFLHPLWLLVLPPLLLWAGWAFWRQRRSGGWGAVVDADLLSALRLQTEERSSSPWIPVSLVWALAALALAGPAWQREQSAAFRAPEDWVIVLDLSPSMKAADVAPDRITRARYAIEDILKGARDARVALIAFAGEAHVVVPLTSDVATVRSLLQPLSPNIMPEYGDTIAPALTAAGVLLRQADSRHGKVLVLTDGFTDSAEARAAAKALTEQGAQVQVIGVGTAAGAPLMNAGGVFLKDAQGADVIAKMPIDQLQALASAGGGRYWPLNDVAQMIASLPSDESNPLEQNALATKLKVGEWRNEGIWLLPPLLLLAAFLARRGWL
jgi:Ca-activated chloride channel family protein